MTRNGHQREGRQYVEDHGNGGYPTEPSLHAAKMLDSVAFGVLGRLRTARREMSSPR